MAELIRAGVSSADAAERIRSPELSWTMVEGLFMGRNIPGLYDEIAAEAQN